MQVLNSLGDFPDLISHILLGQFIVVLFPEVLEESALFHVLEDDVDVLPVVKEPEDFQDVGVVNKRLDLELEGELVLEHVCFDGLFRDLLDSIQGFCGFVDGLVDCAEFAFAFLLADLEVSDIGNELDFLVDDFGLCEVGEGV